MGSARFFGGLLYNVDSGERCAGKHEAAIGGKEAAELRGLTHLAPFASLLKAVVPKAGAAKLILRILFVASEGPSVLQNWRTRGRSRSFAESFGQARPRSSCLPPALPGTPNDSAVLKSVTIPMGARLRFPSIGGGQHLNGVQYFFVEDAEYFDRNGIYGTPNGDYPDNAERYSELCRAAIEVGKHVWPTDVVHCHDWQNRIASGTSAHFL